MGLDLIVGIRALIEDDEGRVAFDRDIAMVNRALGAAGIRPHSEPEASPEDVFSCQMWGYSGLHDLRRLAAHLQANRDPAPFPGQSDAIADPLLRALYDQAAKEDDRSEAAMLTTADPATRFDHLIFHSDADGMYLPTEFRDVVIGRDTEGGPAFAIGSSYALRRECETIGAWLELPLELDPEAAEVWAAAESPPSDGLKWERFGVESFCCLRLHRASRRSIEQAMALLFA